MCHYLILNHEYQVFLIFEDCRPTAIEKGTFICVGVVRVAEMQVLKENSNFWHLEFFR